MANQDLRSTKTSSFSILLLFLASLVSIFLAGGPRQGGMGIFLSVAGLALLIFPAPRATPWVYWLLALLFVTIASNPMLPVGWFGSDAVPAWRLEMASNSSISLPFQITLDPAVTRFWIMVLALSLLIILYLLASPLPGRAMESVALFMVVGCSAYALVAWSDWQGEWHYPFFVKEEWMQRAFGFFPNRNHTAGFLLTGAILSLGLVYQGMNGGRIIPALAAGCSLALLSSVLLFFSVSRGGIVFLAVGILIWIVGLGRKRSLWLALGVLLVTLVAFTFFLSSDSGLLARFQGNQIQGDSLPTTVQQPAGATANHSVTSDLRFSIWWDTLAMISASPMTGTGLGTYAIVYPFYAKRSFSPSVTALHAESDFLTLCSEAGIPTLLLFIIIIIFLGRSIPRLSHESEKEWPVRWAFLSAFFAELLHGLVDVPLHKPELGWWVMILGGIGFSGGLGKTQINQLFRNIQRIFFLIGGGCLVVLGGTMVLAQWGGGKALPPFAEMQAEGEIVKIFGKGGASSLDRAIVVARRAIAEHPMAHSLYYQLGLMLLDTKHGAKEATSVFEAEQLISPNDPAFVFAQGKAMASHDPVTAADFWNEALKRQLQLGTHDRLYELSKACGLYHSMISEATRFPALFDRMPALASDTPEFRQIWLATPYCSQETTREWVNDPLFFKNLQPLDQSRILEHWWQSGDHAGASAFIEAHPELGVAALGTRAQMIASSGDFKSATLFLIENFHLPALMDATNADSSIRPPSQDIPEDPMAAATYYLELGNEVAAKRLLGEAVRKGGSEPGKLLWLKAELAAREVNWREAFESVVNFLHATSRL